MKVRKKEFSRPRSVVILHCIMMIAHCGILSLPPSSPVLRYSLADLVMVTLEVVVRRMWLWQCGQWRPGELLRVARRDSLLWVWVLLKTRLGMGPGRLKDSFSRVVMWRCQVDGGLLVVLAHKGQEI